MAVSKDSSAHNGATGKNAVVFGVTNSLLFALGTMLIGFLKHNPAFDGDFVVFHEDIPEDQKATLLKIYPNIKFRKFSLDMVQARLISGGVKDISVQNVISRYSYFYFAKFELPDLLEEYEKAIWLDVDMLVRAPVEGMWNFDEFCWRPVNPKARKNYENKYTGKIDSKVLFRKYSGPNGGLIGIGRATKAKGDVSTRRLYIWFAEIVAKATYASSDELAFFLLASSVNAKVVELDLAFNCPSATKGVDTAKIVHAVGKEKFWNNTAIKAAYPDWGLWYTAWLALGGLPYSGNVKSGHFAMETANKIVYAARYEMYWQQFYNQLYNRLPAGVIPDISTYNNSWQMFFQAFPKEELHIEISKKGRGFKVGLHVKGKALKDKKFLKEIDGLFEKTGHFVKFERNFGTCWERDEDEENVVNAVLNCANAVLNSPSAIIRFSTFRQKIPTNSNSERPMLANISQLATNYLREKNLAQYVRKVWVYKNNCLVIDFTCHGVSFKFDLKPTINSNLNIDLIRRPSLLTVLGMAQDTAKRQIAADVSLEQAMEIIQSEAMNFIAKIQEKRRHGTKSIGVFPATDELSADPITVGETISVKNTAYFRPLKIGILTLPLNKNFGGNLQGFALMEVLRQMGHEPVLIQRRHPLADAAVDKDIVRNSKELPLFAKSYRMSDIPNRRFINSYMQPITREFNSSDEMRDAIAHYNFDAIIVGSDQVWRAKYARSILPDFFLGFLPENDTKTKRISYAASFGADKQAYGEQLSEAARLLQKFNAVSVREDSGLNICSKDLGVRSQHVLDPTMLVTNDIYKRLFKGGNLDHISDHLLVYVLDAHEDKSEVINAISEKLLLKPYSTNGLPFGAVSALKDGTGEQSVEGWVAAFHRASFIITDSFHGVVFSILFNKPFIAYGNPKRGMARFSSLVKMLGLEDRLVTSSSEIDLEKMVQPINWDAVNARLKILREKSVTFLQEALSGSNSDATPLSPAATLSMQSSDSGSANDNPLGVLCTGCGVCVSESNGALTMSWTKDGFLKPHATSPNVPRDAVKVCPFNTNPEKAVEDEDALAKIFLPQTKNYDARAGNFENTYVAHSKDFRASSSSGGVATFIFEKLLQRGHVNHLFVVESDGASGYRYGLFSNPADIRNISKTRYYPVSMDSLFAIIDKTEGTVAVSGVACFIKAIRLKQHYRPEYRKKIPFLLGIICGGLKSRLYSDFLAQSAGIKGSYSYPNYRVKDAGSTATDYSFSAIDKKGNPHSVKMQRVGNNWGAGLFKGKACDFCTDALTELADISLGDAWLPKYKTDGMGNNVIITRSKLADKLVQEGFNSGELIGEAVTIRDVIDSQAGGFNHKHKGLSFRVWFTKYFTELPLPHVRARFIVPLSLSEALVQMHRERTRLKSLRYWVASPKASIFTKRMRASRIGLKVATAARKDGSNDALAIVLSRRTWISVASMQIGVSSKNAIIRWLRRKTGGDQMKFGMIRSAIFKNGPVIPNENND